MGEILDPNGKPISGTLVNVENGSVVMVFPPGKEIELSFPDNDPMIMNSPLVLKVVAIATLIKEDSAEFSEMVLDKILEMFAEKESEKESVPNDKDNG